MISLAVLEMHCAVKGLRSVPFLNPGKIFDWMADLRLTPVGNRSFTLM